MKTSRIKIFEDYLADTLSKHKKEEIERQLQSDAEMRADLESFATLKNALELHEYKRISALVSKSIQKNKPNHAYWLVAASIVLFASMAILLWQPKNERVYNKYFSPYEETQTHLGEKDELDICIELYNNAKYEEVISCLDKTEQTSTTYFYKAMAYLNANKTPQAVTELKKVQSLDTKKLDETNWYLALAYLKLGKTFEARIELNKLVNNTFSNYKKSKAIELLEKI